MSTKVKVSHDPDIGQCDDCGSDEGTRRRTLRNVTINGEAWRVDAWLCPSCRGRALAQGH